MPRVRSDYDAVPFRIFKKALICYSLDSRGIVMIRLGHGLYSPCDILTELGCELASRCSIHEESLGNATGFYTQARHRTLKKNKTRRR